jgi:phage FluMu protein Com
MQYFMIRICADCNKVLGRRETSLKEQHLTYSHSSCHECTKKRYSSNFSELELAELTSKPDVGDRRSDQ